MKIYKLEYIKFDEEVNNEIYFLGYFSTQEKANKGKELYSKMPGFRSNPNNFEIKEYSILNFEKEDIVFDVQVYFHNKDYSIEYFHCLGLFGNFMQAKTKLVKYEQLNMEIITEKSIVYESFINKHTLDKEKLSEGFDSN